MPERRAARLKAVISIELHLPDDVKDRAQRRAAEQGHASLDAYIEALLREDAQGEDFGAPGSVSFASRSEFEGKLVEALDEPAQEMTDADWDKMRTRFLQRHRGKAGR